ncbi:MAG TPA: enolase C-terminal domain-like protein [Rhodopila sp.]|nr:enolase C-terminal domain-like protein [Rhodopila sp.]
MIQPDLCSGGGLSEGEKIADMAFAYGVRVAPHVWGTGIAIAAAVQLLAVLADWTPPSLQPVEPMLEFDRTEHPVRSALLAAPIAPVAGYVTVPTGPGLGIEIDRDALSHSRAA